MLGHLRELPRDVREQTAAAIRQRPGLGEDVAAALANEPGLDPTGWRQCAHVLISLMAAAIEEGELDPRRGDIQTLARFHPTLTARQIVYAAQVAERAVVDELALHDHLGATSEPWPMVTHLARTAIHEILGALGELTLGRLLLRDPLTTLVTEPVFRLALEQETLRAHRHQHGVAMILFDIDDLATVNRLHGYGAGDRLLERLGILARRFFRTHDWVGRLGEDSIAVLLPETTLDQAAALANRFRETVRQRLVLVDHKTDAVTTVTLSAAAVGTELVQADVDVRYILSEAEGAILRAKMNGGDSVERVALMPTSVTLVGAATLLGTSVRDIMRLVHRGRLRATRRGRHFHIDRSQIEDYRSHRI